MAEMKEEKKKTKKIEPKIPAKKLHKEVKEVAEEKRPAAIEETGEALVHAVAEISDELPEGAAEHLKKPERYFEAVGRRKTAVARVRVFTRAGDFTVNTKPYGEYFPTLELQKIAEDSLQKMKLFGRFRVSIKVLGGGPHSQAEAVRHGIARALTKFNPDFRKRLKRAGFLTRDPRMKERKKFGLKKARRAPQWQKR